MSVFPTPSRWTAAALAVLGLVATAQAGVLPPAELQKLPPEAQKAYVLKRVAEQRARQAGGSLASDTTAPTLTAFVAPATVTAGRPLRVKVTGTDDLSGVSYAGFYANNVNTGESFSIHDNLEVPSTSVTWSPGTSLSPYQRAGNYVFNWAYVYDAAGNYSYFEGDALAALGNVAFTVENTQTADTQAPVLVKGKILTPKVSLSATAPGTEEPAYAAVQLSLTDSGEGRTSGIVGASVEFCLPYLGDCFSVSADENTPEASKLTMNLGSRPAWYGVRAGKYTMRSVSIRDFAGNNVYLLNKKYGGSVDFTQYFPSTTLTLQP